MGDQAGLPRSVRRGPRITLTCECGEHQYVHYGDRWKCEKCARTWDTNRIPIEQYAMLRQTQLRFRRVPLAISALALVCIVVFIIAGRAFGGLIVVALAATTWNMFFRPLYRRRYREALGKLPSWQIEPDEAPVRGQSVAASGPAATVDSTRQMS